MYSPRRHKGVSAWHPHHLISQRLAVTEEYRPGTLTTLSLIDLLLLRCIGQAPSPPYLSEVMRRVPEGIGRHTERNLHALIPLLCQRSPQVRFPHSAFVTISTQVNKTHNHFIFILTGGHPVLISANLDNAICILQGLYTLTLGTQLYHSI